MEQPKAYTVNAITRMIKGTLEESFAGIWVEGELSNFTHHSSGHRYFSLKDDKAVLKGVIWRSVGDRLKFEMKPGQKVLVYGDIAVWEKGGYYQINCKRVLPAGMGELELAFRQLHEKLKTEGLFESERKKQVPSYASKIGIVTSPTGAAIRDIIQIARRRNRTVELIIHPAQVQGDGAENTIAAGIVYFNSRDDIDLLIIGRGGGSLEDLWPFNTEIAVRAVAESRIPIICGVGHEVDTTLCDLAADLRAPTPSAAAELAVWSAADAAEFVGDQIRQQARLLEAEVNSARERLNSVLSGSIYRRPLEMVRQHQQTLHHQAQLLSSAGKNCFDRAKNRLSLAASKLDTLSPLKILARGYTVSRRMPEARIVRCLADIKPGDRMETILVDGRAVSVVEEIKEERRRTDDA